MSKLAALAAVLALVAAVPTAAAYDLPIGATYDLPADLLAFIASTPPSNDFAVGSGRFSKGQPADGFNISAHGSEFDAKGQVRLPMPDGTELRGEVDCLAVDTVNGVAVAGVTGFLENPPDPGFPRFIVGIRDNGEPSSGMRDQAILAMSTDPVLFPNCGLGELLGPEAPAIVQGNLVVKDR